MTKKIEELEMKNKIDVDYVDLKTPKLLLPQDSEKF